MLTLNNLKMGDKALIERVRGEDEIKRRLLDLGFIPGSMVKCVLISPFKNPKAYLINQNTIALRNSDASLLEVELC